MGITSTVLSFFSRKNSKARRSTLALKRRPPGRALRQPPAQALVLRVVRQERKLFGIFQWRDIAERSTFHEFQRRTAQPKWLFPARDAKTCRRDKFHRAGNLLGFFTERMRRRKSRSVGMRRFCSRLVLRAVRPAAAWNLSLNSRLRASVPRECRR